MQNHCHVGSLQFTRHCWVFEHGCLGPPTTLLSLEFDFCATATVKITPVKLGVVAVISAPGRWRQEAEIILNYTVMGYLI